MRLTNDNKNILNGLKKKKKKPLDQNAKKRKQKEKAIQNESKKGQGR